MSSDGFGGKTLQMAVGFGYDRRGFEGCLGNICLHLAITKIRGLNVNTTKQNERRKNQNRRSTVDRRTRPKLRGQLSAIRDGTGLNKRTDSDRRKNKKRRKSKQEK